MIQGAIFLPLSLILSIYYDIFEDGVQKKFNHLIIERQVLLINLNMYIYCTTNVELK